jgi:hypothetical protein
MKSGTMENGHSRGSAEPVQDEKGNNQLAGHQAGVLMKNRQELWMQIACGAKYKVRIDRPTPST